MNKKNLQFHIERNDYFVQLATFINNIKERPELLKENEIKESLDEIKNELLYLQKNYKINTK